MQCFCNLCPIPLRFDVIKYVLSNQIYSEEKVLSRIKLPGQGAFPVDLGNNVVMVTLRCLPGPSQ